ncbi:NETI motif-containing protein [Terribacillus saccharophilus]|uniref:NETI motif-containing protein n=1 Tax=Terribacillus saccharophilus TaxID=361277 RepID=UPI002DC7CA6E|nr:NETI motif-containing protein [Terribacillus saccharophilus]MEC0291990.1 NETI motif-containing protein [Terribacillus saccharophilus]
MPKEKKPAKKRFELGENETIEACLDRIKAEGYLPVRKVEEPIFRETTESGAKKVEPIGRKVIFDTKLLKTEH